MPRVRPWILSPRTQITGIVCFPSDRVKGSEKSAFLKLTRQAVNLAPEEAGGCFPPLQRRRDTSMFQTPSVGPTAMAIGYQRFLSLCQVLLCHRKDRFVSPVVAKFSSVFPFCCESPEGQLLPRTTQCVSLLLSTL